MPKEKVIAKTFTCHPLRPTNIAVTNIKNPSSSMHKNAALIIAGVLVGGYIMFRLLFVYDHPGEHMAMHEYAIQPESVVIELKAAAERGDVDAMTRLATHYGIGLRDEEMLFYYSWMAAKKQDPAAISNWHTLKNTNLKLAEEMEEMYPE